MYDGGTDQDRYSFIRPGKIISKNLFLSCSTAKKTPDTDVGLGPARQKATSDSDAIKTVRGVM